MKRKSENTDDCQPPTPKEQKTDADDKRSAATRFWMHQTLVGSQMAPFLTGKDKTALAQCCKLQRDNLDNNPNAQREYFCIPSLTKIPLPSEKDFASFYKKIPAKIIYLHIDVDLQPANIGRLFAILGAIATKCCNVDTLHICRSLNLRPLSLDSRSIPIICKRLIMAHQIRFSDPQHLNGIKVINVLRLTWTELKIPEHSLLVQTLADDIKSVALDVASHDLVDAKESGIPLPHWRSISTLLEEEKGDFVDVITKVQKRPFKGINALEIYFYGVYSNETCGNRVSAELLHRLFPDITRVYINLRARMYRPVAWIQDDINYFLDCKSIAAVQIIHDD